MNLSFDVALFSAFLLAMVRATAWLFIAPPFSSSSISVKVRLGLGMAFAIFIAPHFPADALITSSGSFIVAVVYQAAIGLAMGFGMLILMSALQTAGALIDMSAGFSHASVYDPFSNAASTPMSRLYQMLGTVILFASGGHAIVVRGFLTSFTVAGQQGGTTIDQVSRILIHNFSTYFSASLQIAIPVIVSLFMAEIAFGLIARAAPQLQILPASFAVKMFASLLLVGFAIKVLPAALYPLVEQAADTFVALGR